jgi:hypothetical protein
MPRPNFLRKRKGISYAHYRPISTYTGENKETDNGKRKRHQQRRAWENRSNTMTHGTTKPLGHEGRLLLHKESTLLFAIEMYRSRSAYKQPSGPGEVFLHESTSNILISIPHSKLASSSYLPLSRYIRAQCVSSTIICTPRASTRWCSTSTGALRSYKGLLVPRFGKRSSSGWASACLV